MLHFFYFFSFFFLQGNGFRKKTLLFNEKSPLTPIGDLPQRGIQK